MGSIKDRIRGRLQALLGQQSTPKETWDQRWSRRTTPMRWETEAVPQVLIQALDDGFFPARASVLDIGCGAGDIAAWLASRNHRAVGTDFSSEAIARAESLHQHESLQYRVSDMASAWTDPEVFDCLFDRGCLHCLPESDIATYVANTAASLHNGGRFLLLHKLGQLRYGVFTPDEIESRLRAEFNAHFDIERVAKIDIMDGVSDKAADDIPALALWMTRRAS